MSPLRWVYYWLTGALVAVPVLVVAATPPTDEDMTFWARNAIRTDPRIDGATIQVSTQDGIVKLIRAHWGRTPLMCGYELVAIMAKPWQSFEI